MANPPARSDPPLRDGRAPARDRDPAGRHRRSGRLGVGGDAPRFDGASAFASGALNLLGYRAAAERGVLLLDHADGLVTILPSAETLAVRPFLLVWLVWVVLRLARNPGRMAVAAAVGLAATVLVGLVRYVVLLAVYADHDDILAGGTGLAALDIFHSPWITGPFLLLAGFAADRAVRWLRLPRYEPDRVVILPPLSQGLGWVLRVVTSVLDERLAFQCAGPGEVPPGPTAICRLRPR